MERQVLTSMLETSQLLQKDDESNGCHHQRPTEFFGAFYIDPELVCSHSGRLVSSMNPSLAGVSCSRSLRTISKSLLIGSQCFSAVPQCHYCRHPTVELLVSGKCLCAVVMSVPEIKIPWLSFSCIHYRDSKLPMLTVALTCKGSRSRLDSIRILKHLLRLTTT